ncbi:MAG: hypothetical protein LBS19_12650 [Clostridiales bacterium]|jgi:hypothetical protein|nr:hypothetical protein [Clostridiales bacterium]
MGIRAGKPIFAAVFIILGIVSITLITLAMTRPDSPVKPGMYIEAGSPLPEAAHFLTDEARLNGAEAYFAKAPDVSVPGEYKVNIMIGKKAYPAMITVKDTKPPTGAFISRAIVSGNSLLPEDFITDASDATAITFAFETKVDFTAPGVQPLFVSMTDAAGNKTTLNGLLTVFEGVHKIYAELGYPLPLDTGTFLKNPEDAAAAVFATDISAIDFMSSGNFELVLWINDVSVPVYLDVTDTLPPVAEPKNQEIYLGQTLWPWDFVQNVNDFSNVDYYLTEMPDWSILGEQPVTALLKDASGNESRFTAMLNIIEDTHPPVIVGAETKYALTGAAVAYRKGVSAWDANDGEVDVDVDTGAVNILEEGTYPVYYSAADAAGNIAAQETSVVVTSVDPEEVYMMADEALSKIITAEMSQYDMGRAIYTWVRQNVNYDATGEKQDVIKGAYNGLKLRHGDCYTFFALMKVMLDRVGIPNHSLERVGGQTRHYWSLINTGDGWMHCDSCPYREYFDGYQFTETKALQYTAERGRNYYEYDRESLVGILEVNQ